MCTEIHREAGRMGLVKNPVKTKYVRFSPPLARRSVKSATINGTTYEGVTEFIYLGMLNNNDNSVEKEIQTYLGRQQNILCRYKSLQE